MTNDFPESFSGIVGRLSSADVGNRIACIYFFPECFLLVISGQFLFLNRIMCHCFWKKSQAQLTFDKRENLIGRGGFGIRGQVRVRERERVHDKTETSLFHVQAKSADSFFNSARDNSWPPSAVKVVPPTRIS